MKRNSLTTVFVIDGTFKRTLRNQLLSNRYLEITSEVGEQAYEILIDYLEASPQERGKIEKVDEIIKTLRGVFPKYASTFMRTFTFLYESMLQVTEASERIRYGRGIAIMLYVFCDYINGLSMKL